MSIKLVVLYPTPTDPAAFERAYHAEHMPLMRRLITPDERTPTFKIVGPQSAPFYRMAEVHFETLEALTAFATSAEGKHARASAQRLSTGGETVVLVCQADAR